MEKSETAAHHKRVEFWMSKSEYSQLQKHIKETTEKTVSGYLRKVALNKPVIVTYRNASADDFLRDMVELKKELRVVANNYDKAVKKLLLLEKIAEFRAWILTYESSRLAVLKKIEQINLRIIQLYEQWLLE